jgi:signal peptidase II
MNVRIVLIMVSVLLLDQLTKFFATTYLSYAESIELLPFFSLTLLHNTGAAFSFLADAGGWQQILFLILAVGVSGFCIWTLCRETLSPLTSAGYVLLIPGALGNAIDRVYFGYVVDFIHLHWNQWSFPAFNIADVSITVAACALLMGWYLDARHRTKL